MAFAALLRRSASSALPLARRAVRNQARHHCLAPKSAANRSALSRHLCQSSFPSVRRHYSSRPSSDASLLKVIESEIKCAEESDDHEQVEDVPDDFPFEIEDNPGQQTITLTREYRDESVTVEVHMPDLISGEHDDDNDGDNDDAQGSNQSSIPLVVRASKRTGSCLEFGCTAFPDEIAIDSLSIKDPKSSEDQIAYEGPDFSDLDENLQKAFHKFLEIRGIKPNTANYLHEYMVEKDSREYLMWLKNLKKFVEA